MVAKRGTEEGLQVVQVLHDPRKYLHSQLGTDHRKLGTDHKRTGTTTYFVDYFELSGTILQNSQSTPPVWI